MRITQQKNHLFHIYSITLPSLVIIVLIWSFRLMIISRPILIADEILGASADKAKAQEYTPILKSYPIFNSEKKPKDLARFWIIYDNDSGKVLAGREEKNPASNASTTKIMTALLVLENIDNLQEQVTIEKNITSIYQNRPHVRWGEKFTVENLLYILMMESDNQVANVLADYVGEKIDKGSKDWESRVSAFVKLMNQKGNKIGLTKTTFSDPAGLDPNSKSTAFDLSLLTREALKNSAFKTIVKTRENTVIDIDQSLPRPLKNSNRLVSEWNYPGIIGVKTGYLLEAGHCLVATAEKDGHTLTVVVLNTYSQKPESSAEAARYLLDHGFANTTWY